MNSKEAFERLLDLAKQTENLEECKGTEEVDIEFYRKECKRLVEANSKMEIIIEALIEELKRRVRYD